jgi:hypothetical protein
MSMIGDFVCQIEGCGKLAHFSVQRRMFRLYPLAEYPDKSSGAELMSGEGDLRDDFYCDAHFTIYMTVYEETQQRLPWTR